MKHGSLAIALICLLFSQDSVLAQDLPNSKGLQITKALADTSVTPSVLTIIGQNFGGRRDPVVFLAGEPLPLVGSPTDTEIRATLPQLTPGSYLLIVAKGAGDNNSDSFDLVIGARGPKGDAGAIGPLGPIGPAGPQGPVGPQGREGTVGPQGAQGPQGPAGESGPAGPQGIAGPEGPQGERGFPGAEGPAGPSGPQGPVGPRGPRGLQGVPGPEGPPAGNSFFYGTTVSDFLAAHDGRAPSPQEFNWTVPQGVTRIFVELWGGGGGGGGTGMPLTDLPSNIPAPGGGGGAGGYTAGVITIDRAVYQVVVGNGGREGKPTPGRGETGGRGGFSQFAELIADGGQGGGGGYAGWRDANGNPMEPGPGGEGGGATPIGSGLWEGLVAAGNPGESLRDFYESEPIYPGGSGGLCTLLGSSTPCLNNGGNGGTAVPPGINGGLGAHAMFASRGMGGAIRISW